MVHLAAIPFSGASVNPARTFGPDLIGNEWDGIWIYLTAPLIGAVLAVGLYKYVHGGAPQRPPAPTAEVLSEEDRQAP